MIDHNADFCLIGPDGSTFRPVAELAEFCRANPGAAWKAYADARATAADCAKVTIENDPVNIHEFFDRVHARGGR
jgi:hypothetical protein